MSNYTFFFDDLDNGGPDEGGFGDRDAITYYKRLTLVSSDNDAQKINLRLNVKDTYRNLWCFAHETYGSASAWEPDNIVYKNEMTRKFKIDDNFPYSWYDQLSLTFFKDMTRENYLEREYQVEQSNANLLKKMVEQKQREHLMETRSPRLESVQDLEDWAKNTRGGKEMFTNKVVKKNFLAKDVFGADWANFFEKIKNNCEFTDVLVREQADLLRPEEFSYDGNEPSDVHEYWRRVFENIRLHVPSWGENGESDVFFIASDSRWKKNAFDISVDADTMSAAQSAYAETHARENFKTFLHEDVRSVVNKANQWLKTYFLQNKRAVAADVLPELEETASESKPSKSVYELVKQCILEADPNFGKTYPLEAQIRLFILNLILIEPPSLRGDLSYETLLFGEHGREDTERSTLKWSFRLAHKAKTESTEITTLTGHAPYQQTAARRQSQQEEAQPATTEITSLTSNAFGDVPKNVFREAKKARNDMPQIINVNEVHYHIKPPQTDLSDYEKMKLSMDELRQKENVIFEACQQIEEVLRDLKHRAGEMSLNAANDDKPRFFNTSDLVRLTVRGASLFNQLKYELEPDLERKNHSEQSKTKFENEQLLPQTIAAFRLGRKRLLRRYAAPPQPDLFRICCYTFEKEKNTLPLVVRNQTWAHHFSMLCAAIQAIDKASNQTIVADRNGLKKNASQKMRHALDFFLSYENEYF